MVQDPNSIDFKTEEKCLKEKIKKTERILRGMQRRIQKKLDKVHIDYRDSDFNLKIVKMRQHENHLIEALKIMKFDENQVKHFHVDQKKDDVV